MKTKILHTEFTLKIYIALFILTLGCTTSSYCQQRFASFQGTHEAKDSWPCSNSSSYSDVTIVDGDCNYIAPSCWESTVEGSTFHLDNTGAVVTVGTYIGMSGKCPGGGYECSGTIPIPESDLTIDIPRLHCEWGASGCKWANHYVTVTFTDPYAYTDFKDMSGNGTSYFCVNSITDDVIKVYFPEVASSGAWYNLVIKDAWGNELGRASCGNTPGEKVFSLSDFSLSRSIWDETVYFITESYTTGGGPDYKTLFINTNTNSIGKVFLKPFPNPAVSYTKPSCYGGTNAGVTLTFPTTDVSKYVYTISQLKPKGTGDCSASLAEPNVKPYPDNSNYCLTGRTSTLSVTGNTTNTITINNNTLAKAGQDGLKNNFTAGPYELYVELKQEYGISCLFKTIITIPETPELILTSAQPHSSYTWDGNTYQIKGYGATDAIEISLSGGTGPYRYSYNDGVSYTPANPNTSFLYTGVPAGIHTVRVTDDHNCQVKNTIPVPMTQPDTITITGLGVDSVSCHTGNAGTHSNGRIQFNINGGIGKFTITLNDNPKTACLPDEKIAVIDTLSARSYKVIVTDLYNFRKSFRVSVPSHKLLGFNAIAESDKYWPPCVGGDNGSIKVSGYGGTPFAAPKYKFGTLNPSDTTWATYNDSITDLEALHPYNLVIKDRLNCTSRVDNVVIRQNPNPLKSTLDTIILPLCNSYSDGKAIFTGTNGLPFADGYDFTLKNVATHQENSLRGSTVQFEELPKGTYEVIIKDQHDCVINNYYRDTVDVPEPYPIHIVTSVRQVSRKGLQNGSIEAVFSGGNKKYEFKWYSGLTAISDSLIHEGKTDTLTRIDNLRAGDYLLQVRDTSGCSNGQGEEAWFEWSTRISEPAKALSFTEREHRNVSCNGLSDGRIVVEGAGGWGNSYRYGLQPTALSYDSEFNHLEAGLYTVYVVDEQDEVFHDTIRVTEPRKLAASEFLVVQPKCYNDSNGSIELSVVGGTQPYSISVDNNVHMFSGTKISGLLAGVYDVLVTDYNQCKDTIPVTVTQPNPLLITLDSKVDTRCGENTGAISVTCSGGTPGYSYQWINGKDSIIGASPSIEGIVADIYRLSLTDTNSCSLLSPWYTVFNSDAPTAVDTIITPVSCFGYSDGKAQIRVDKGVPPYTYEWSNGQLTDSATGLQSTSYSVIVTDSKNCKNTFSIDIPSPAQLTIAESSVINPQCFGYSNGSISVSGRGGTSPYQYAWSNGLSGDSLSGLNVGSYTATVTDSHGCTANRTIQLSNPDPVIVDLGEKATICGGQTVQLDAGNFVSFRWSSDNGFTSLDQLVSLSQQGSYYLEVTDLHGCIGRDTFSVITSNGLLNADFLIKSEAFTGDTVVAIDISWPLPESTRWEYDTTSIKHFSAEDYENLIFTKSGKYLITMYAALGECRDNYSHEITIKDNQGPQSGKSKAKPLIQKFTLYPNPSNGNFTAEVELREESDITLKLFGSSLLVDSKMIKGLSRYRVEYNLPGLPPGMYILNLVAGGEQKQLKLIVN